MELLYQNMLRFIRKYPSLEKIILFITKYFPMITFCMYPCILIYLLISKNILFIETLWKPLVAFILVSIFRKLINRPRPYETMDIKPLLGHKHGESFPSRHTLSAMIIALVCFNVNVYLGIFLLIVAILLSACRILAGVHFISDVLVSVIISLFFYFL